MKDDTVTLRFSLFTNRVGSLTQTDIDVEREEWDDLDDAEQESYARDLFWEAALGYLGGWSWEPVGGEACCEHDDGDHTDGPTSDGRTYCTRCACLGRRLAGREEGAA